jgi:N-acetylmuramoyl-L-alanine amidase
MVLAALMSVCVWADKPYTVVLDPGHGGKDPGAVGRISQEKDLNLKLALKIGELINEQYPDVNVVYTRKTDVFIPLQTRSDISNKSGADLFISIHTNSAEAKSPNGVETFILGTDRSEANLDVAMRENAVMKLEADYKTTYHGFDPNSIDSYIMFELMQNSYMDQSLRFAELVQQRCVGQLKRGDRGVRQAAFWVLLKTACPSILFEMGFISNVEEEKYLNKASTMEQMAQTIVDAFGVYTHREAVKKETLKVEEAKVEEPAPQRPEQTAGPQQPKQYFALQICASKTPLAPNDPKLKGQPCECLQLNGWYKYYTAADPDRAKVMEARKQLLALFPDCWIIKIEK